MIGLSKQLEQNDLEHLVLSGLFHDFSHHGGKFENVPDSINIERSIKFLKQFHEEVIQIPNYKIVKNLILCTEFPYIKLTDSCTLLEKIIRDADMCSVFENNFIFTTVFGLAKEFDVDVKTQVDNQILFMSKLEFHTDYCKQLWTDKKQSKMDLIKIFKDILND